MTVCGTQLTTRQCSKLAGHQYEATGVEVKTDPRLPTSVLYDEFPPRVSADL